MSYTHILFMNKVGMNAAPQQLAVMDATLLPPAPSRSGNTKPGVPVRGAAKDAPAPAPNFLRAIVAEDCRTSKYGGRVVTRFPPEPNGYLHYGHAKSIILN